MRSPSARTRPLCDPSRSSVRTRILYPVRINVTIKEPAVIAVTAGLVAAGWGLPLRAAVPNTERVIFHTDFRAYYTAARMLAYGVRGDFYEGGRQFEFQKQIVASLADPGEVMLFVYPAVAALPFVILTLFPIEQAYFLWLVINSLLVAGLARVIWKEAGRVMGQRGYMVAVGLAAAWMPVYMTLVLGQMSMVLVWGVMMAYLALRKGRDLAAGWWLGLLVIKPHLLLIPILWLITAGKKKALGGLAAAVFLVGAGFWLLVGTRGIFGYLDLLKRLPTAGEINTAHPREEATWNGQIRRWLDTDNWSRVGPGWLAGAAVVTAGWLVWAKGKDADRVFATMMPVMWFTSLRTNYHDMSLAVITEMAIGKIWGWKRAVITAAANRLIAAGLVVRPELMLVWYLVLGLGLVYKLRQNE